MSRRADRFSAGLEYWLHWMDRCCDRLNDVPDGVIHVAIGSARAGLVKRIYR